MDEMADEVRARGGEERVGVDGRELDVGGARLRRVIIQISARQADLGRRSHRVGCRRTPCIIYEASSFHQLAMVLVVGRARGADGPFLRWLQRPRSPPTSRTMLGSPARLQVHHKPLSSHESATNRRPLSSLNRYPQILLHPLFVRSTGWPRLALHLAPSLPPL
ncbi:unnamed protein product [Urochloa humidicola]